jgi:hypothetical protein
LVEFGHLGKILWGYTGRAGRQITITTTITSKIPGDNGSSLNIPITKIIKVLANITLIETSVLAVYP